MSNLADALHSVAVTLWAGSLWAIGYIAAPTLFARLSDRALAGMLAGKLFTFVAFIGMVCAAYLIIHRVARFGPACLKQGFFWIVLVMLVLVLAGEFGVQPILDGLKAQALPRDVMASVFRDRFNTWHGVASGLYVIESILALALVVLQHRGR